MNPSEKYEAFRNFMFNELGVTKEDIRNWIKDAIAEQAVQMYNNTYEDFDVEKLVNSAIVSILTKDAGTFNFRREIIEKISNCIADKLVVNNMLSLRSL